MIKNIRLHLYSKLKPLVKFSVFTGAALLLTVLLNTRIGMVPPLGPFSNPWSGFWQNMESGKISDQKWVSEKLQSEVTVIYDERGVPHIFAQNDYDLYFAQGFVTARDRLWQIDFQARAAAGRLSEVLGEQAVDFDREQRRLGMLYGAEINAESMAKDPRTAGMIRAYGDGYNAWLGTLNPKDYPVEYKILDTEPEPFTDLVPALLLMNMSKTLTSGTRAHAQTNARALLDDDLYKLLYPGELPWVDPVIPPDQTWDFEPLQPDQPEADFVPRIINHLPLQNFKAGSAGRNPGVEGPGFSSPGVGSTCVGGYGVSSSGTGSPGVGSNSWAVDGSKTESGYPLLSSDPHLALTLPSIWYEIHLNSEGINTYGVSLPAAPGIVIGINEFCAWGITNAGSTVLDIYEIEFRDENRQEYWHDGEWKPVTKRPEKIKVRGGDVIIDTVLYTHHGPVTQPFDESIAPARFPEGHAVHWLAHYPENVLLSLYKINRAGSQDEFEEGLRHFTNITQNFTYADRAGNISMGHIGKFPVRFKGQGDYIADGRDPAWEWNRFIPFEHLPRSFNPERGFVSSANQAPVSCEYPYYLGRFYANFSRGSRINHILSASDAITPAFFEEMLMDDLSLHAAKFLPFMLAHLDLNRFSVMNGETTGYVTGDISWDKAWDSNRDRSGDAAGDTAGKPSNDVTGDVTKELTGEAFGKPGGEATGDGKLPATIRRLLENWNYHFDPQNPVALFYKTWEENFYNLLWNRFFQPFGAHLQKPDLTTTFSLLLNEKHEVFPAEVTDAVNRSFKNSLRLFTDEHGDDPDTWCYGRDRELNIEHLGQLPGFGREDIVTGGTPEAINAVGASVGPSWRMIVELGPEVKARGHFPGGQTGNPGNPEYDRFVDDWANGTFHELYFWSSAEEASNKTAATLILTPD